VITSQLVSTIVNASGAALPSNPIPGRGRGFRLLPLDGPADFPRIVTLEGNVDLLVTDPGWLRCQFDSLRIAPAGDIGPTQAQQLPPLIEQWLVIIAREEEDFIPAPALLPKAQKLWNSGPALYTLPAGSTWYTPDIDLRNFPIVQIEAYASNNSWSYTPEFFSDLEVLPQAYDASVVNMTAPGLSEDYFGPGLPNWAGPMGFPAQGMRPRAMRVKLVNGGGMDATLRLTINGFRS